MKTIDEILSKYHGRSQLIDILEEVQDNFGYISEECMHSIEQTLGIPLVDIYGVATFYAAFRLHPPGRHTIKICTGTACHVKGANQVKKWVTEILEIESGETTKDGKFSVECVNCIGACAKAPSMMVDDQVFGELTRAKIENILMEFS